MKTITEVAPYAYRCADVLGIFVMVPGYVPPASREHFTDIDLFELPSYGSKPVRRFIVSATMINGAENIGCFLFRDRLPVRLLLLLLASVDLDEEGIIVSLFDDEDVCIGRVDSKPIPAPPPTHQHQTCQAFHKCYSTRSHGAELRSRRFREGSRVRASKVKDGSSVQRNSEEWESAACWTSVTGKEDRAFGARTRAVTRHWRRPSSE
ncbi:hypothetical protein ARMGADRAFT_1032214 [Armillaria gallica]|uniref:Uncharacterized protein n=1 Tax=Armillaria gallica TaxID=47427 RepID=A0A2H3DGT2_ARMGA|nr:hypothetical protein ARMGADRAFT_1032214 [Armillaria gallica]